VATAGQWAVLRPERPGQARWAAATMALYPVQCACLTVALHFHADAGNPAKAQQHWLSFLVAHVYIVALPSCVPFFLMLAVVAATYYGMMTWAAHIDTSVRPEDQMLDVPSLVAAFLFYSTLIVILRFRSRHRFADYLLSRRGARRGGARRRRSSGGGCRRWCPGAWRSGWWRS